MPRKRVVAKDANGTIERFGERLARLRQAAGYSQRALAAEIGISQRMVAYYEKQTDFPPTHLLPLLAIALDTSADELLGIVAAKDKPSNRDTRLWRRFHQLEKLPANERNQLVQIIDAFLERHKLKSLISA